MTLGQRALATFPYYAVFDRANTSAYIQIGSQTATGSSDAQVFQIIVIVALVIFLFAMLIYLIYLRRARIQAEEWLELNKNTLFSQHSNLKSEEEILDALVQCNKRKEEDRKKQNASSSPNAQTTNNLAS